MDRETVITHLQIIHTWASFALERDLQFFTEKHLEDITQWVDDALKLLKDQEAKCMTKEELSGLHEQQSVWLEGKHGSLYRLRIIGICAGNDGVTDIQYDTPESYIEQSTEKYGVTFRLWTAQPTDEQRQAVKWNG